MQSLPVGMRRSIWFVDLHSRYLLHNRALTCLTPRRVFLLERSHGIGDMTVAATSIQNTAHRRHRFAQRQMGLRHYEFNVPLAELADVFADLFGRRNVDAPHRLLLLAWVRRRTPHRSNQLYERRSTNSLTRHRI